MTRDDSGQSVDGCDRPTIDQIIDIAEMYEPLLSTRQSQTLVAWQSGYSVEEMVELFGSEWGVTDGTTEHNVQQALQPAKQKFNTACRLVEDFDYSLRRIHRTTGGREMPSDESTSGTERCRECNKRPKGVTMSPNMDGWSCPYCGHYNQLVQTDTDRTGADE